METLLTVLTDVDTEDEPYVDLAITCVRKNDPEGDAAAIISGVPPVRVYFSAAGPASGGAASENKPAAKDKEKPKEGEPEADVDHGNMIAADEDY